MQVRLASSLGFCMGVRRALRLVEGTDRPYVLGALIHNPQIIERLKAQGVRFVSDPDDIDEGTAVISAHGAPDSVKRRLLERGIAVIDATCPLVEDVHNKAKQFEAEGCQVFIMGDSEHAEVKAIAANLENAVVLSPHGEAPAAKNPALVSQTTQRQEDFERLAARLKPKRLANTICDATQFRQESAKALAGEVDLMIVVGGFNSSNTRRLKEICSSIVETRHIEQASELRPEWFLGRGIVGITAGASTPDWIISEVRDRISRY